MSNEKQKHNERELSSALQSEELTMNTSATCTGTSDSATTSTATTDVSTTRSTSSGLPVVGEKSVLAELKQFDTQVQDKYDQQHQYDQQYEQQYEQDKEKEQLTEVEALSRDILRAEKQEAKTLVEDGDMCATYRDPVAETALWQGEIQPLPRPSPRATTSSSNTCTGGAQAARASVPGAFAVVSFRPTPTSATFDDLDYENETSRDATTTDPDQGATAHNTPTIADLPSSSSERQPQICPLAATLSPDETATAAVTVACTRSVVGTSYTAGSSRELSLGDDPSSSYTNYDPEDPSRSSMVAANTSITPAPLVEAKVMHGDQDTNARPKDWFFIALMMAIILVLLVVAVTMALALAGLFQQGCSPDCDDEVTPFTSWTEAPHNESVASGQAQAYSGAGDTSAVLSSSSSTASTTSLLEKIRQDGVLECLYLTMPGLYHRDEQTGEVSGFNSEWCKAVAAAIMGPKDYKIEYIDFNPYSGNFGQLNPLGSTFTMTRHVREARSKTASYFSAPIFYDGLQVAGDPFFVECVQEKNFQYVNECADLRACTMSSSAHGVFTLSRLPKRRTVQSDSVESVIQGFVNGSCNVMFGESASVAESTVRGYGYQGNYTIGDVMFTKVPNSLQSRGTDRRFGDFMNAVVQALFVAEQHNITKSTAHLFPQTSVFGDEYKDMFRNALAAVGNYGEIYHEHLDGFLPRTNINQINDNNKEEGRRVVPIRVFCTRTPLDEASRQRKIMNWVPTCVVSWREAI
ncbi:extracellular solute-binding protein [Seminavis robusta]|uniref:Extracellular solute-binding protein n=1 Tax=Seminavis robusta TaxID=568900 RepID=A0A9N8D7N1_9STRA|nr:extracellular solute-binding protein [Seminavis robusta]|eukprot:Sro28_g018550.1 extracellular solute-binding protein (749) ;mRNA; r:18115-20594